MSHTQDINFEDLTLLLKASNKQQVVELCQKAFENCGKEDIPNHEVSSVAEMLSLENTQSAKNLLSSLGKFIKVVLFHGHSTIESISSLFPSEFHKNLRELLSKIIAENFSAWRATTVSNSVSLPKLVDFDWRVDLKMASGKVARMNAPTCILHLKIDDPSLPVHDKERLQTYNVELSKESLDTMLNGLGRIRDQLSAVAKK